MLKSMQDKDYRALQATSQSTLRDWTELSPAAWLESRTTPKVPTDDMTFGSLVHAMMFEPHTIESTYVKVPKIDRRTTVGKAAAEELAKHMANFPGIAAVDEQNWLEAEEMADRIRKNDLAKKLIIGATYEQAVVGLEFDGEPVKGKLDALHVDRGMIVDLKTTSELSLSDKSLFFLMDKPGFKIQASFYIDLMKLETGRDFSFCFLMVQRKSTKEMRRVVVSDAIPECKDWLDDGRRLYKKAMNEIRVCRMNDFFPSYIYDVYYPQLRARRKS